jgi:hypothetical protein
MSNVTRDFVGVKERVMLEDLEDGLGGSSRELGVGLSVWAVRALL